MSKTLPSASSGDDLNTDIDLPVLQLEALNVDYAGAILDMPMLGLQTVELESPLDSDEEGLTCVDCGDATTGECEDCGDPLCSECGDVCSYCVC